MLVLRTWLPLPSRPPTKLRELPQLQPPLLQHADTWMTRQSSQAAANMGPAQRTARACPPGPAVLPASACTSSTFSQP